MKKKWIWGIPLTILLILVIAMVGIIFYIRPTHQLDLNYKEVDWKTKLLTMVETQETVLTLNEEEINDLAKKGIAERTAATGLSYQIEGLDIRLNDNEMTADAIVKWGSLRAEAAVVYHLSFDEGRLLLKPQSVDIRGSSLSPSLLKLKSIVVDPGQYLPEVIQITDMAFENRELKIKFAVNWLQLPGLLR
ncbi:hypothetical protein [Paenibacillus physcomitrellae]|uniref:DUF2140 family protein n=1 Tax=Paenibacillus physcomitrellae TaxID=1619311 RepID=A0ABQ1GU20_9BACL|nr:hypothetical protein [Paenibacillus physcomitrellae]GGA50442.1 hypothetical protein GCM10010917_39610 [Paenibacillus physcomitrellae]